METTPKILIRKNLFFLTYLISFSLYSQTSYDLSKETYREDQIYFGSSYFIQSESISDFKQNGFSGNFQFGLIRDFPLNNNSTKAVGLGVGYERNFFTSNIQPDIENNEIVTNKKIVDIQTPQVYKYKELFECYSYLSKNNITGMVDTTESMFNFNKYETQVIRGEESNLKITYKSDLEKFEKATI